MKQAKEIIKFSIAGIFVVGTDAGVYYLLIHFLPKTLAKGISFTCGGVVAYLINKYWTFKQQEKSPMEVVRFIVANSMLLGLNVALNALMLQANKQAVFLALAVSTAVTAVSAFLVFKFWVFSLQEYKTTL